MTKEEAFDKGLDKWPQMKVTGDPVSKELAEEIILRTDDFFGPYSGGNNHDFDRKAAKLFGKPNKEELDEFIDHSFDIYKQSRDFVQKYGRPGDENFPADKQSEYDDILKQCQDAKAAEDKWYESEEDFKKNLKYIHTEYVHNSWFSSPWIGGPHGWMHPDGTIGFIDNVGKWPSVEDIYNDWMKITEAWPQLNLKVTLMSDEEGSEYNSPVVTMIIHNGTIEFTEDHITEAIDPCRKANAHLTEQLKLGLLDDSRENWYSLDYIKSTFVPLMKKLAESGISK